MYNMQYLRTPQQVLIVLIICLAQLRAVGFIHRRSCSLFLYSEITVLHFIRLTMGTINYILSTLLYTSWLIVPEKRGDCYEGMGGTARRPPNVAVTPFCVASCTLLKAATQPEAEPIPVLVPGDEPRACRRRKDSSAVASGRRAWATARSRNVVRVRICSALTSSATSRTQ